MSVIINNLEKSYKSPVLKGINLEIPQGQILGIIGKSGAGKTTLLRCLNGLEDPNRGTITIDGLDFLKEKKTIQQKIGNVFQTFNLLSRLNVLDNVLFPLKITQRFTSESKNKALNLIEIVGLKGKENSYPSELSGGQSQRVAIARALITDASLLLCDEFTSALDYETSLDILELLKDLNKRLGITIVLITHDMAVVREICDEVCVIESGEIVEKNDITSIILHPKHAVTKTLIRSLVIKDLPHHLNDLLMDEPKGKCSALLRSFYSSKTSGDPIIASLVKKHDVPINILVGNLDHIRETAFGSLIISIPYQKAKLSAILNDLENQDVSTEVLGYLPEEEDYKWNS